MLLNCGVGEDSWKSLDCKEIQPVHPKGDQSWVFIGRTDAEAETPILWPPHAKSWLIGKDWCWERLKAGGEWDDRGWDAWMASPTRWTWVWVDSGRWWWTGRPGVLQFMGSQRVGHDWVTELNWSPKAREPRKYIQLHRTQSRAEEGREWMGWQRMNGLRGNNQLPAQCLKLYLAYLFWETIPQKPEDGCTKIFTQCY